MKTDLESDDLKGRVRYVISKRYDVVDTLGKESKMLYFSEFKMYNKGGNYIFDKSVNVLPAQKHFDDSTHYDYDSYGNILKEENYDRFNKLNKRITTDYDATRRILKEVEVEYDKDEFGVIEDSSINIDSYTYNQLNLVYQIHRVELLDSGIFSPPRVYISNNYEDSGRVRYQLEYGSVRNPQSADTSYRKRDGSGRIIEGRVNNLAQR